MRTASIVIILETLAVATLVATSGAVPDPEDSPSVTIERKTCRASNSVTLVYSAAGSGESARWGLNRGGCPEYPWSSGVWYLGSVRDKVGAGDLAGIHRMMMRLLLN